MLSALAILLMVLLNRVRGGGLWLGTYIRDELHIKPLFLVTPAVPAVALLGGVKWLPALALGLAYLAWALPAWGRWFDLNHLPDDYNRTAGKYADPLEKWIDALSADDIVKMYARHGIMLLIGLAIVSLAAQTIAPMVFMPLMTVLIVSSYVAGWAIFPEFPILIAELLVGAVWGLMIGVTAIAG